MKTFTTVLFVALALSACAKGPDAIAPISMGDAYLMMPCDKAATRLSEERARYNVLASKQKGAVAGDAIGVFLIGVPMSSLTGGDVEGQVAESKGKILALEARQSACTA